MTDSILSLLIVQNQSIIHGYCMKSGRGWGQGKRRSHHPHQLPERRIKFSCVYLKKKNKNKKTVTSLHILCFFLITVCAKEGLHCVSAQCLTGTPRVYDDYMLCVVFAMCIRNIGLSWWLKGKESACNAGDLGLMPEWGRSPGKGHGNPLQYSCLENPHGQRTLGSYPRGCKESDTTERLSIYLRDIECV